MIQRLFDTPREGNKFTTIIKQWFRVAVEIHSGLWVQNMGNVDQLPYSHMLLGAVKTHINTHTVSLITGPAVDETTLPVH